jgi:hypothetical protein
VYELKKQFMSSTLVVLSCMAEEQLAARAKTAGTWHDEGLQV